MMPGERDYSEKTAETIDIEVKRITDEAFNKSRELIEHNRDKAEQIAKALLKYETLDADDVEIILAGGTLDKPTVADLLAAEQAKDKKSAGEKK
jgi:cell division protease FtsH